MNVPLNPLVCPRCAAELHPRTGYPTQATCFEDCLRRCDACGIGFSNGRHSQTRIHRNSLDNIPPEVMPGAEDALVNALNEDNRANKKLKFGFSSSEDALTWTVFSFLHASGQLGRIVRGCGFVQDNVDEPAMLLWGVPHPAASVRGGPIRTRVIEICDRLGEKPRRRSEPDVILDFADDGLIIVEVKYRSGNDQQKFGEKHEKYLSDTDAFTELELIRHAELYELTRNWRIGVELAEGRPFTLVNLMIKNKEPNQIRQFRSGLNYLKGNYRITTWRDFLSECNPSEWPLWFKEYLDDKLPGMMPVLVEQP